MSTMCSICQRKSFYCNSRTPNEDASHIKRKKQIITSEKHENVWYLQQMGYLVGVLVLLLSDRPEMDVCS